MPERRGSWDSFPQFIRWSRPPSFYVRQPPVPAAPPVREPAVRMASQRRGASRSPRGSGRGVALAGPLKGIWQRCLSGLRAFAWAY